MLEHLAHLFRKYGTLSGLIIDEAEDVPSADAYQSRFGGLVRAYQLIGFTPDRNCRYIEVKRALRALHRHTVSETVETLHA